MSGTIRKLTIEGYKSIRKLENFELRDLNVLIGANGAGKSNFVGFFRLLRALVDQRLQHHVAAVEGGADACLYFGPKMTPEFNAKLYFGNKVYEFSLVPTPGNGLAFAEETLIYDTENDVKPLLLGSGHVESRLTRDEYSIPAYVAEAISSWVVYHFHDTGPLAAVRRPRALNDNEILRQNAENLAPFLYRIQTTDPANYTRIRDVTRLATPFFDDFKLRPIPTTPDLIQLEWQQRDSDYPFRASQLSDGTLRFICLATALLQPWAPATMLFDEPELGLHPYALGLLGALFKQAAEINDAEVVKQVIICTQSAALLNEFEPEDVIVVERSKGASTFKRLDSSQLSEWLDGYTLGELWQKDVLGGWPGESPLEEPLHDGARHS